MFNKVEGTELYEGLYRAASAWLHWSPRQMHLAIVSNDNVRRHEINDPQRAAQALAAGVASLHRSITLLNDHIALGLNGLAQDLDDIANRLRLVMHAAIEDTDESDLRRR